MINRKARFKLDSPSSLFLSKFAQSYSPTGHDVKRESKFRASRDRRNVRRCAALTATIYFPMATQIEQRTLRVTRLGRMEYGAALAVQKETARSVVTGEQPNTLFFVEHPHVLTIGRRATQSGIVVPQELLNARGVSVFETNRGGKVTYHGLGQLVGYPIINLKPDREDVLKYVRDLEDVLIQTLADFDIEGFRIKGLTGVHTSQGKIAAIGVHIARWVTTHGFALNVNTDLSYFNLIVACEGEPVTSMQKLMGRDVVLSEVEDSITTRFVKVFGMTLESEPGVG